MSTITRMQSSSIKRAEAMMSLNDVNRTNEAAWIIAECNRLRRENLEVSQSITFTSLSYPLTHPALVIPLVVSTHSCLLR